MSAQPDALPPDPDGESAAPVDPESLQQQVADLERRVRRAEQRRRALLHIMGDLNESNRKLAEQRKAMLHILADYEADRSSLARHTERLDNSRRALLNILKDSHESNRKLAEQRKAMLHILADYEADRSSLAQHTERLDNSRRALLNILKDSHESNLRLGDTRKAMIHIMGDLRDTTQAVERREQELRDKQEQLVQAAKLATLGELTTGVAHELNNPLNNIGLFVGNVIDRVMLGESDGERLVGDLEKAMEQVRKATEIITHLRTFGRAAAISLESVDVGEAINRALALTTEQLRQRDIDVELDLTADLFVLGNPIQLEQVFINLLTNARDALSDEVAEKRITITTAREGERIKVTFSDTGPGIPPGLEQRIFDPFFTTKEVGTGTGLGLSITYGIVKEHGGQISVAAGRREGACFEIELPVATEPPPEETFA